MALIMYDDIRNLENPRAGVLDFLESSYQAGAKAADWDAADLQLSKTPGS